MRARTIALLTAAALGLGACGDDDGDGTSAAASSTTVAASSGLEISTDLSSKPNVPKPSGDAPTKLATKDIVVGTGREAKAGDRLAMHYVGVAHSSGEQFDASWDRGSPYSFVLGKGEVITGWDEGIEGMKIGGRRLLVIPPDLAYGEGGQGSIGPNETLVFVVDLLNVTPPS